MKRKHYSPCVFFTLILAAALTASAALDIPKTPAGKRAAEIIGLINGQSPLTPAEYVKANYTQSFKDRIPASAYGMVIQQAKTEFGPARVVAISHSTPEEISLSLKSETREAWLDLALRVEPQEPYLISSLGLAPASAPSPDGRRPLPATKAPAAEAIKTEFAPLDFDAVRDNLKKKADADEFSGVVLVAKDGKILFQEAYGFASKTFRVPNRPDTKFNLGSCNKLFTSIAAAQLMQQGKLSIGDPIGKYLDMFPKEIAAKVTIRHLLDMSSGWGDYWDNAVYLAQRDRLRTVSDYLAFIKDIPLDFEPGSKTQHSNTGFEVAGAVIEKVSGMEYYDYIRERIYRPAGMKNSGTYHRDEPVENMAVGYTNQNPNDPVQKGYQWTNVYMLSPRGTPAGGGYATAEDLLLFDQALRNNKLLSPEFTRYLLNRYQGALGDPFTPPPGRIMRIVGGAPGISAVLGMDFSSGATVIVLSNYDFPVALETADEIIKTLNLER